MTVHSELSRIRQELDKLKATKDLAEQQGKKEQQNIKEAETQLADIAEAIRLVQTVAAAVQAAAHEQISAIVTRCLEAIFDDPYVFKINFEQKRGKTEAKVVFARDETELGVNDVEGAVCEVASFALRLACLLLSKPGPRRLLVLDEPFRCLSKGNRPRVRGLLVQLCRELDLQIIQITHSSGLVAGKVIDL